MTSTQTRQPARRSGHHGPSSRPAPGATFEVGLRRPLLTLGRRAREATRANDLDRRVTRGTNGPNRSECGLGGADPCFDRCYAEPGMGRAVGAAMLDIIECRCWFDGSEMAAIVRRSPTGAGPARRTAAIVRARRRIANRPRSRVSRGSARVALLAAFTAAARPMCTALIVSGDEAETGLELGLCRQLSAPGGTEEWPDSFAAGAALIRLVDDQPEDKPVVIVVDDAHLADPASLRALTFALRRLSADSRCSPLSRRVANRCGGSRPVSMQLADGQDGHLVLPGSATMKSSNWLVRSVTVDHHGGLLCDCSRHSRESRCI